ncbi:hypothetical protein [Nocardia sp. NPDC048505]|uniref:hypothetical protein n=1 Tax=unclassified Nocardia TaxID=2637762 RepID=UPI0033EF9521
MMNGFGVRIAVMSLVAPATLVGGIVGAAPQARAAECHASYDPCVQIDSDVDCVGGGGNGPGYTGRVRVIGPDVYELDDNGDGVGCENS